MKKIMFNEKYGLNAAVIKRLKNMTRRMIPQKTVDFILNDFRREYFEATLDRLDDKECLEHYFFVEKIKEPPYKVGDIVAIAQAYQHVIDLLDWVNTLIYKTEKGWTNKMFVCADIMPHHIKITDLKIERLQDISDEDCLKEGIEEDHPCYWVATDYDNPDFRKISDELADHLPDRNGKIVAYYWDSPRKCFAHLIDKVSGKGTWERNPWVFAYTFELID